MSSYSFGQVAQFVKKSQDVGVTPEALSRLGQATKEQLDMIDAYLQGSVKFTKVSFLNSAGSITLPAVKKPSALKAGDGVWLSRNAEALFRDVTSHPISKMEIEYGDLTKHRNDHQILEEIGDESIFEPHEASSQIARLLFEQAGGAHGALHNDGKVNILYVRNPKNPEQVLYVGVFWYGGARVWGVRVSPVNAYVWDAGDRVFRKCGSLVS